MNKRQTILQRIWNRRTRGTLWATAVIVPIVMSIFIMRPESVVQAVEGNQPVHSSINSSNVNSGFANIVEAVSPAVISIEVTRNRNPVGYQFGKNFSNQWERYGPGMEEFFQEFFDRRRSSPPGPRMQVAVGSGVIFDPDGYIITNLHVVNDVDSIIVTLSDGTQYEAQIVGSDQMTDLAVLKIEPNSSLPYAQFGDSEEARVGDWVLAIGDPFGLSRSASLGIISAKGRHLARNAPSVPFLQVDAAVNRGNSGGPLFNTNGQVIGINTMIFSPSGTNAGVGFAIPSAVAKDIADTLINDGHITRGWLGVIFQSVTEDIADTLELDRAYGALVTEVQQNSPADMAAIQVGDVIVEYDGSSIDKLTDLSRLVKNTTPGNDVTVTVWRNGEMLDLTTTISVLNGGVVASVVNQEPATGNGASIGAMIATLNSELRSEFGIDDGTDGVVIVDVRLDSPAAASGLQPGDVIKSVNRHSVTTPEQVTNQLNSVHADGKSRTLIMIERNGSNRFITVAFS